jgi:hypothetical protein
MKKIIFTLAALFSFSFICVLPVGRIIQPQTKIFQGSINNKLPILMTIDFVDNKLKGTYYYMSKKIDIEIKGTIDSNNIMIEEFSGNTKTGVFLGQLNEYNVINGQWTSPDGKKSFPFFIEEVGNNLKGNEISGQYDLGDTATIYVLLIDNNKIKFQGSAIWIGQTKDNVHTGEVAGITDLKDGKTVYDDGEGNILTITFKNGILDVAEEGQFGGMNVTFAGKYVKEKNQPETWDIFDSEYNVKK